MPRPTSTDPTNVELAIHSVLWEHGPSPLGQIHQQIAVRRRTAYSSTRKMVQVMCEKGLIRVDASVRPQLYLPVRTREQTQAEMLDSLVHRVFGGSKKKLLTSILAKNSGTRTS